MNVESRLYRIGGHVVRVRLEQPWTFKALTDQQSELTDRLRRGEDIGIESVPADRQEQVSINDNLKNWKLLMSNYRLVKNKKEKETLFFG